METYEKGDWFLVSKAPDGTGGMWYNVLQITPYEVRLERYKLDGSTENYWERVETVELMLKTGAWTIEKSATACNRRCTHCGQVGDHRGLQYYPLEGECRIL